MVTGQIAIVAETVPCWPWPVTSQVTTPPYNAGRSTTQPDTAIPPTCGNPTNPMSSDESAMHSKEKPYGSSP